MSKNIIITGGELYNKGAQAMVFTVVNEMKKKYPNKNIYLFSTMDYERKEEDKEKYNFEILPSDLRLRSKLFKLLTSKLNKYNYNKELEIKIKKILKNTDFAIDISGYNLSSQLSTLGSIRYLLNIKFMKKYNIELYILPQSLGPFNYKFPSNILLKYLLKKYLKYPKKIIAREKNGYKNISKFTKNNLYKSVDIVLQQSEINLENIFKNKYIPKKIKIKKNSIGIIPNEQNKRFNKKNDIFEIYKKIIKKELKFNKTIYILRHSYKDLDFCKEIKYLFKENDNVILIEDDLNSIELNHILEQFDYVIASRYHSIIHSYKNNVPALIIGWAIKYKELSDFFNQKQYCFDIRKEIEIKKILEKTNSLDKNYIDEKKTIKDKMKDIKENNLFDEL